MSDLTYRTAGESHGKGLITLVEGLPAGVPVDSTLIDGELRRRQGGDGRGGRGEDEADAAEVFTNDQKMAKDTAGGVVEAHVFGCPIGLGSCMTWDGRLDSRLAAQVMSIQAFKGVEIGLGFEAARRPGSKVHDEIFFDPAKK